MRVFIAVVLSLAVGLALVPRPARAAVTPEQVRNAIRDGVTFLRGKQAANGSWPSNYDRSPRSKSGGTALITLALLTAGQKPADPTVARALAYLRGIQPQGTYTIGLHAMVFANAEPARDMQRLKSLVAWLEKAQVKKDGNSGMWGYSQQGSGGDNSNTQYALLGLKEAAEAGVQVSPAVWKRSREHFLRSRGSDGSWAYRPVRGRGGTGSMTVAGLASLLICGSQLHVGKKKIDFRTGRITNCGVYEQELPVAKAIEWIGKNFSVRGNPMATRVGRGPGAVQANRSWHYYYLYGLERAGRISAQRFFGRHDWYREGAEYLLGQQRPDGSWVGGSLPDPALTTSFALLFLAKGRWPVLVNKIKWRGDWNNDHNDISHLCKEVAKVWEQPLTWQVVDIERASVEDLLMAPICYLDGHQAPDLTDEQVKKLREYVIQGGFLWAEACCNSKEFDEGFRRLMDRMFPEPALHLRRLEADHPIWRTEFPLEPFYPLEGIELGCRTSVVYSSKDMSSYWEVDMQTQTRKQFRLGINICAYATGREVKDKLEAHIIVDLQEQVRVRRVAIELAKLRHGGGWDIAQLAVPNLMAYLRDQANLDVVLKPRDLPLLDKNLRKYPVSFMEGKTRFKLPDDQLKALREYLDLGGFVMANAICGSVAFDESFREMVAQLYPGRQMVQLKRMHDLYKKTWFVIDKVKYSRGVDPNMTDPILEGLEVNGRLVIVYSKFDLSCALERHPTFACRGYSTKDAFRVAANILLYALRQ